MYTLNVEYFYSSTAFEHFFKYWTSQLKSGKEEMEEKSMLCDMLYSLHLCCFVHKWIKLIQKKVCKYIIWRCRWSEIYNAQSEVIGK